MRFLLPYPVVRLFELTESFIEVIKDISLASLRISIPIAIHGSIQRVSCALNELHNVSLVFGGVCHTFTSVPQAGRTYP